ncbi:LysR family transcriptional regulator [Paenibacillus sp. TAB 01]|uniref:LysR family transcriptional regulator n=1 Tax=Paenibacillus sp. TAB 01 TaxID=3368988 RepID=UPI0037517A8D
MDVKTLKTFQTIVACGSFHKAAEELSYAQSTITMQIQKLEAEVGVQLIERGKHLRLTEAGRLFYEQSLPILHDLQQLQTRMADMQAGEAGHVRLGVTEPAASYRLPGILQPFVSEFPRIRVSVDIGSTAVLCERILSGELDLALASAPELGAGLYFEPLFTEQFVLLLPEGHPLEKLEAVAPKDMRDYRLLITSESCPYRKKLELVLQESGRTPMDTMEIGSMAALQYYVQSGLGIALVPRVGLSPAPAGTIIRPVKGRPIDMTCGLICKASDYPLKQAGARLYRRLQEHFRSE